MSTGRVVSIPNVETQLAVPIQEVRPLERLIETYAVSRGHHTLERHKPTRQGASGVGVCDVDHETGHRKIRSTWPGEAGCGGVGV